jgi:hypothetical protein
MVTPSLGGKHSNVGITVAANTFTDVVGNTNTTIAKNKLNVIVLAVVFAPPLPVIIRVGLTASSTKLPLTIKLVNKSVV